MLHFENKPVIGMIHLSPLPGSPNSELAVDRIIENAIRDGDGLHEGGVDALMMENFGDTPFFPGHVPAVTVACMTHIAHVIKSRYDLPLGINVLRNDGISALAVAVATGADFVRVNVLCGARLTDQGIVHGIAHQLLRQRAELDAGNIQILADVDVKHSAPLAEQSVRDEVSDTLNRGGADAVIVSGTGTGQPVDVEKLQEAKGAAGDSPVLIGSGASAETIGQLARHADGFIVGSSFKSDGIPTNPVEVARVEELVRRLRGQA